jgi:hypothetical protein
MANSSFYRDNDDHDAIIGITEGAVRYDVEQTLTEAEQDQARANIGFSDETGTGALVFAVSPTLSGTPAAPTASPGTGTTQIATTAYVDAAVTSGSIPDGDKGDIVVSGSGAVWTIDTGVVTAAKLAALTSAELAGKVSDETGSGALVFAASPTLSGVPLAPTAAPLTSTTQIATTEYVDDAVAAGGGGVSDGDYGDITVSGSNTVWTIDADVVSNAKLANMAEATVKGRAVGAGTGDPTDLTAAQLVTLINTADGSGSLLDADLLDGQSSAFYATATSVSDHLADATAAHAASAISFTPAGSIAATDVQAALAELDTEKQPLDADLTAIAALTTAAAGRSALTLADPNADRIFFWDDSAGTAEWLTLGTNLSITGTTINAAGGSAVLGDADYGDITVSGTGTVMTIDNDVVTYAKMQDISATSRVLGRITASAGDTEELTGANVRTITGLATTDSPEFAALNVGAATDTTITRVSAGVIAVEGSTLLTAATGQPLDATLTSLAAYNTNGLLTQTAADTFTGRTVTGTAARISVTNGNGVSGNPTLDIDATYVGQASITTLGTITTGVWTGTDIAYANIAQGSARSVLGVTGNSTADLASIQGTASQVLRVNSAGTALAFQSSAALTKVDDTNVTLTLGGTPTTALLDATSLTLGWTGTLAIARGGTGAGTAAAAATALGVGTGDSPQFTAVNIGAATDTTVTRVSAGVIAVEGNTILTTATGQPLDADLTAIAAVTTTAAGIGFLTLADPNIDRIAGWDDSAGAAKFMALADINTEASPASGDFLLMYDAAGNLLKTDWANLPSGGGSVTISATAPGSPSVGDQWWDPENDRMAIYYDDGTSSQWVATLGRGPEGETGATGADSPTLKGYIYGCTLSNAADAANDITVSIGQATDEGGAAVIDLTGAITKRLDATWAVGDNQGGLNTGAEAVSTWYEVHLIKRVDTNVVDVMFTTTANRATLPTNYTLQRRIGWIRNDGASAILPFTQVDDHFTLTTQVNDVAASVTTTAAAVALTAPPNSIARFRAGVESTTSVNANAGMTFSEIVEGSITPAITSGNVSLGQWDLATGASAGHFELRVSATSTIEHDAQVGSGTFDISTYGWIDHRRRYSAT